MKKIAILSVLTLLLALAGCASAPAAPTTETAAPEPTGLTTVDEFLAAIAPNAEIVLAPGDFDLTLASSYGKDTGSPYYRWENMGDGFGLVISEADGLTIRGAGKDRTEILTRPRNANVLLLENCRDFSLEGMKLGHTEMAEPCGGGVLQLSGCSWGQLEALGLYGCGTEGIGLSFCSAIRVSDTDIYDCSSTGIGAYSSSGLRMENCRFYNIGSEYESGYAVLSLMNCQNVTLENCSMENNHVYNLVNGNNGVRLLLRDCTVTGTRATDAMLSMYDSSLTLESCRMEDNTAWSWLSPQGFVTTENGGGWTEQMLIDRFGTVAETKEVTALPQKEVHVSTAEEFLAAIGPNTEIVLDGDTFDFSTARGYGTESGEYYGWEDIFDGPGLVIRNVDNMTIRGGTENYKAHTLEAVPRYANVLTLEDCSNITLSGFTAGHTREQGECTGGVIALRRCTNTRVLSCGLFGCGTLGVEGQYCDGVTLEKNEIYDCTYGGVRFWNGRDITLTDNNFHDLGGEAMGFNECAGITVNGNLMDNGYYE